jgi:hypothetical protein
MRLGRTPSPLLKQIYHTCGVSVIMRDHAIRGSLSSAGRATPSGFPPSLSVHVGCRGPQTEAGSKLDCGDAMKLRKQWETVQEQGPDVQVGARARLQQNRDWRQKRRGRKHPVEKIFDTIQLLVWRSLLMLESNRITFSNSDSTSGRFKRCHGLFGSG